MSATSTSATSTLIATALCNEATRSSGHRRLFLGEHLGVNPREIFDVLMQSATFSLQIQALQGPELRCVAMHREGARILLIPYLVTDAGSADRNSGSEGYAALLRSRFRDGAPPAEVRVLLVLDPDPVETIRTAAEDAADLQALSWAQLCTDAAHRASPTSPAAALAEAVADDLQSFRTGSWGTIDQLARFAEHPWPTAEAAGRELWRIGFYLADPRWSAGAEERLRDSRAWRRKLDTWLEPGVDLESKLRGAGGLGDSPVVDTILEAVGPAGLDYTKFIFDDLEIGSKRGVPALRRPLSGYRGALTCSNGFAVWLEPSGGHLTFRASGRLTGVIAQIVWVGDQPTTGVVAPDRQEISFRVEPASGPQQWRFGMIELRKGRSLLASAQMAAYLSEGSWFPVEGGRLIDSEREAFVVSGEATALLVTKPRNLGQIDLDISDLDTDRRHLAPVTRNQETHALPIFLVGEASEEPPDEPPEDGPDAQPETLLVASPVHAMLRALSPELAISERGDPSSPALAMTVGTDPFMLERQLAANVDTLELERQIISTPGIWVFALSTGEPPQLEPDSYFERLSMEGIASDPVRQFQAARHAFFRALERYGTAYAAGEPSVRPMAFEYIKAYAALLQSLPEQERGRPEFDRCLLIDSIEVTGTPDRYVAPTHPLTVAFYLAFWEMAEEWTRSGGTLLKEDLDSITPAGLLPVVNANGSWYEIASTVGFLWKRYQVIEEALPAMAYDQRFIAKKLDFFLTVHPSYRDPRQTLSVCVFEPGDGAALVSALQSFYEHDLKSETDYELPRIDLRLVTPDGKIPQAIYELLAAGQGRAIDRLVRSRVQVSVARANPASPLDTMPPFAHLTFVHRTSTGRRPGPVALNARATTFFCGGLAAAPGRLARRGPNEFEFFWGSFGSNLAGKLAARSQAALEQIVARSLEVIGGQQRELLQSGVTRMLTTTVSHDFMVDIYDRSIWVVHLERLIGVELFTPDPGRPQRYLIDYEESFAGRTAVDGITATEHVAPYRKAVSQALEGFDFSPEALDYFLNLLNAVEGSWALQLLHSSHADILEKAGVAMAIAVLQHLDRSFEAEGGTGVLFSVEELLAALPGSLEGPAPRKADDLVYLWIPHTATPEVQARVIEVKFASKGAADVTGARQQVENTCEWLEKVFNERGPGRLFRARDLAEIVRAALGRNETFRLRTTRRDAAGFEQAIQAVAGGDFAFKCAFRVGSHQLRGDVVAVELESSAAPLRTAGMPGAGEPIGLIRVGRPGIEALADGRPIVAAGPWERAYFVPASSPEGASTEAAPSQGQPVAAEEVPVTTPATRSVDIAGEVRRIAKELDAAVIKYGLELEPFLPAMAQIGPSVIRFRTKPLGRQPLEGIARRAADLGREVGVPEGVIVGQEPYFVTVDVPRRERQVVYFADQAELLEKAGAPGAIRFLLGMAPSGEVDIEDIARLPHLLIAGATGSGKSMLLRSILCSLLLFHPPEELKIFLVDPKQIDFLPFEDVPHLVNGRIITDPAQAVADLQENIEVELARRRPMLKAAGVTNVLDYYEGGGSRREFPQMVIVVDEFADLASALDRDGRAAFMSIVQRYGQVTRAFGIYLVLATQRPSVQVITGDIKANLTARVALKVLAPQDSVTILGHAGAEALRDRGDLIFEHAGRRERLQGFFVRPQDVANATSRWRASSKGRP